MAATTRQIVEITVKSVLNRVKGMPFKWSLNPYRGCLHGCVFCYARRTHWFLDEDGVGEWSTKIFVKTNAPEVLRRELARPSWAREEVALGTATDPYQAIEARYRLTRRLLEALRAFRTPVSIVTRSPLICGDLEVLTEIAKRAGVTVCVSIVTTDPRIAREIEPTVALPAQRLRTVRRLAEAGIRVGIILAPILPGLTDTEASLDAVVGAAHDHGAHFVSHNVLHLGDVTRDAFLNFLKARHPALVPRYLRMYRGKYAPDTYRADISDAVEAAKTRHGVVARRHLPPPAGAAEPAQLPLFAAGEPRREVIPGCERSRAPRRWNLRREPKRGASTGSGERGDVERTAARRCAAAGTAGRVASGRTVQVDAAQHGDAERPRQHVGEFSGEGGAIAAAAEGLRDFADLLDEPAEGAVHSARPVPFAKRRGDLCLQRTQIHAALPPSRRHPAAALGG
jgi:DNA repair photolyase